MPKGNNKEMKIMSLWKARKAWIFAIVMGLGMMVPMAPTAVQARGALPQADQGAFRHFAERILSGIGSAKFSDIPAIGGYGRPRVAVLPFSNLSGREREVLRHIAEGLSAKEVASELHISPKTVEAHRTSLMRKLGVRKATELVRYAVRHGLIEA